MLRAARVSPATLQRLEDRFADRLADAAVAAGFTLIEARMARAMIDLNRAEDDMDPAAMLVPAHNAAALLLRPSARARAGLGLIPHRLADAGLLWREPVTADIMQARIATIHRPYHQAVAAMLADIRARWGHAILLDLHSMPSLTLGSPQIVIGDRFGATARSSLSIGLAGVAGAWLTARNTPYAGAHGVQRHADRLRGIDAVQIEIDRALYLADDTSPDHPRLTAMAQLVLAMALHAEQSVDRQSRSPGRDWGIAAE